MNLLDILLAIPLVYCIWKGYRRGLIFELSSLAGIVLGCYLALKLARLVADLLSLEGDAAVLIAFFIIFVAVVVLSFFLGKCIEGLVKLVKAGVVNNLAGAAFGMLKCVCILSVLLYYVSVIDKHEVLLKESVKQESLLYSPIEKTGNKLIGNLKTYVAEHKPQKSSSNLRKSE